MTKRRKKEYYLRTLRTAEDGAKELVFVKVFGWVGRYEAHDGSFVEVGYHRNEGSSFWHVIELTTGLAAGGAVSLAEAEQCVLQRVDAIARLLRQPQQVRYAEELAAYAAAR